MHNRVNMNKTVGWYDTEKNSEFIIYLENGNFID